MTGRASGAARPPHPRTAREMLDMARAFLERKELEEARLEAELLVAHALGTDRLGLFLDLERPVLDAEVDLARDLLVRRGRREPVAYIVGQREFYGRAFQVGPGVLIPRPETELLVDRVREVARERGADSAPARILDVGTGSGCLAVTLALEVEGARVLAVDVSTRALEYARANARRLGAVVEVVLGDGPGAALGGGLAGPFDWIVSNPPYVDPADRATLAPELVEYEPDEALFAPAGDVDHWVRRLLDEGPALLAEGGRIFVELGVGQAQRAPALAEERGFACRVHPDLARIGRVLEAWRG